MVVFAMDVVCHSATKCHKLCARGNRKETSFRDEHLKDRRQAHTALRSQDPREWVEGEEVVESGGVYNRVVVVQTAIAVTSTEAKRKHRAVIFG